MFVGLLFILVFLAELFVIFTLGEFLLWILFVHTLSLCLGLALLRQHDLENLAFYSALKSAGEPITKEFMDEVLILYAIVLLLVPSLIAHTFALVLLNRNIRQNWLIPYTFYDSI